MAWRNPLFQKKRGGRTTGVRSVAHWSELFLSVSLVIVGAVTLALHIFQVLLPDWRESRAPRGYQAGTCQVTELRVHERANPLGILEYGIEIQAALVTDDGLLAPVWFERQLGGFSPTRGDALQMAEPYRPETRHPCWYDVENPTHLMLRRPMRWWVWPVTLIPASLFAVGVFGIVASLMQVATSAERRSLVTVKAVRLDPMRDTSASSTMLPAIGLDDQSPGTHYPHRLPAIGTAGWRMAGLMMVTAIWNMLLAFFVYVASREYLEGNPPWLALMLVVLLGVVGVWLAYHLIIEFWHRRGIGQTHVELSHHPLVLGGEYRAYLMQTGRMEARTLLVELVCEESASYQQGTDSRTSAETVLRHELRKWRNLRIDPSQPFEVEFDFTIPARGMHSFRSPHNEIRWMLVVRGETSRGQDIFRQFVMNIRTAATADEEDASAGEIPETVESPA